MNNVYSDHYFKAKFIYDYGKDPDTIENIGFRLRGNTSRVSQKKSFKISFNEYVSGRKYQGVKKINLNGQHNDPTLMREKLYYDIWKKAGMVERRTSFVKLYINNQYYGLYTNLEEFDKDWLSRVYNENEGNLYKCTYPADLVYLGSEQQLYKNIKSGATTGGRAYELQTNETKDDYTDLVNLVTQLNKPADVQFETEIGKLINVDEFIKAFAIDVATGNWDNYMFNKNNYFLYHNQKTGKFEFISYDCDNTIGVDWIGKDWATRNCLNWWHETEPRPLASKLLAIPSFQKIYKLYLDSIARFIINPDSIFSHVDDLKNLVSEAALTDVYRTLDYGYTMSDFYNGFSQRIDGHTPYGIKPFLTTRLQYILQQIHPLGIVHDQKNEIFYFLFPNPAVSIITVQGTKINKDRNVWIADLAGNFVLSQTWTKGTSSIGIDVNNFKPGLYTLIIESGQNISTQKFIKQ